MLLMAYMAFQWEAIEVKELCDRVCSADAALRQMLSELSTQLAEEATENLAF